MKRRDAIKSLAVAVSLLAAPETLAMPEIPKPQDPEPVTRRVFLVETKLVEVTRYSELRTSGEPVWGRSVELVNPSTDSYISVSLNEVLFHSLKKGDVFVMYEGTGELVGNLSGNPVLIAESDSFVHQQQWTVKASVYKETYAVPDRCDHL